jgi:hypothetical protein
MTAAHFLFIPAVLVIGIVIGWILGARAAQDAFSAELKRREERAARHKANESLGILKQAARRSGDSVSEKTHS